MNTTPLTDAEYRVVRAALAGDSYDLVLLRTQLESVCYESRYYRGSTFMGIPYRRKAFRRIPSGIRFKIRWGMGTEDWQTANRADIHLKDLVIEDVNLGFLSTEVCILNGLLREFRILGPYRCKMQGYCCAPSIATTTLSPKDMYYLDQTKENSTERLARLSLHRSPSAYQDLIAPVIDFEVDELQSWLLSLDSCEISITDTVQKEMGILLPLRFRRTKPASKDDLEDFERLHQVVIPIELRSLWSLTNGGSFFGSRIYSSADARVHMYKGRKCAAILGNHFNDMCFMTVQLDRPDDRNAAYVFELRLDTMEDGREWPTLRDCLEELSRYGPWGNWVTAGSRG